MTYAELKDFTFKSRHIGPSSEDEAFMLQYLGFKNSEEFISAVIPDEIFDSKHQVFSIPDGCDQNHALKEINTISKKNVEYRSLIGLGYFSTVIPPVVQRNVLENPNWYTAYTPYQAEISQGRLEALFNFQTLISELTGLQISNASLLDEATAAAEAISLSFAVRKNKNARKFLIDKETLPQTFDVLKTRCEPLEIELEIFNNNNFQIDNNVFGIFLQLPGKNGRIWDPTSIINQAHNFDALVTVAIDPLAQVLIKPMGEFGADIVVGSAQRLGVPISCGGPHAAFFATKEIYKRQIPGRIVGRSVDVEGNPALRLALQTREQHIRRDKATSNICTAQVLLAVLSSFYAVHHGPDGLTSIAKKIVKYRACFESILSNLEYPIDSYSRFDSIDIYCKEAAHIIQLASDEGYNLRVLPIGSDIINSRGFGVTFDELTCDEEIYKLYQILAEIKGKKVQDISTFFDHNVSLSQIPLRDKPWLQQSVFNTYQSETELMRYIHHLVSKDFSLVHGMIPLGSCTMKLNAAAELLPIEWNEFSSIHPFAPKNQLAGFEEIINDLESWLSSLTGFEGVSLQPNAGSQGEFAGLLVIRSWHMSRGEGHRNICLIPTSAHGTNPASAVMSGFKVVSVKCDDYGNVDLDDLRNKSKTHSTNLAALMVTYPSTHGVFEPNIREICQVIHQEGGQVYLDGANLNAQVGICRPGSYGIDVCHLNLHKTFSIPHGGGGPGVGPIAVASHLTPYLPGHSIVNCGGKNAISAVSAAPFGSAGILPISWMYIRMMGSDGLRKASSIAILSANYLAKRLDPYYPVLFKDPNGLVAHECILDLRPLKTQLGIEVEDVAKRLMDYGFHAPTISWPVAGTLMVEPTESESLSELDRFCNAMIGIREEIEQIKSGKIDPINNPLKQSPHTLKTITSDDWDRPYSRKDAAYPLPNQEKYKFWPSVSRINNAYGDRNLICSCPSVEDLEEINSL
ncbi:aminomethyl-transferring glycine dehydrogenase [Prochlorococcus marinus]|uniref:Glycine dehydrogenase (decarboxylating) n=1 Tax=Prochlorococcus marinus XMU1408 TaxID=2213228 RepID=A0A318QZV4_PROMR|nr:aminomethyl-transferring glycine dehydrogenase [Prochlorococcus marinus]MBW3042918.1 glycine dehydrogenase (aminomethyl-transferring) [Prochlorococcus marinus str. XMU1408]PYE00273.1 glycine dehydrogenase (aminomethyl-transferring) [Prochlorococcus marinus XMU1408]